MMEEIRFETALSEEEILKNFEGIDLFSGLVSALGEALAYEKGNANAAVIVRDRNLPDADVADTGSGLDSPQ